MIGRLFNIYSSASPPDISEGSRFMCCIFNKDTRDGKMMPDVDLGELLKRRFVGPRLFLNPHLKLSAMAEAVGTNRTYLSRYLNVVLGKNFYEYVNSLRADYAAELLRDTDKTLADIATMSGFNSYTTFRRTFLGRHGLTPSDFRQQLSKKQ